MKIGIITLYGENNYGNKLQNYALKTTLEKYFPNSNIDTIAIKFIEEPKTLKYYYNKFTVKKAFNFLSFKVKELKDRLDNCKRKKVMKKFSTQYLNVKNYILDKRKLSSINDIYNKFVIGSDQVWNYNFVGEMLDWYFAMFSPKEKNIVYSASFGIDKIDNKIKEHYIRGLNNMLYISVREDQGVNIVKELINKEVPVLVDPTMLLTIEEWNKICKSPKCIPTQKYVLTYFLGKYSSKHKKIIYDFAKKNKMIVINLGRVEYKKYYSKSPSEFIWYIKHASMMITDSFHGTVFSLLFKTPFYVMNRDDEMPSMFSRIVTLLNRFDFKERLLTDDKCDMKFTCNFDKVDELLNYERKRSFDYLNYALGMKENYIEN